MFGRKREKSESPDAQADRDRGPAVVLVGHCGFDSGGLTRLAQSAVPGAAVVRVNSDCDLAPYRHAGNLLLVNRALDGRFAAGTGVELIAEVVAGENAPAAMLVSNYPDAQAAAEGAGALPGFGKSEMGSPDVRQRIAAALAN